MPQKKKIGKQRRDKFYKLAKETGFRSRAAFKLIQLNRKFEFLQKTRVLLDLCAAPGGWLQAAHQAMPVSSLVIGVDLVPIKPIGNIITLVEDITTDKCRKAIKKELKTWKVDTVLHDGAPNVGKSWIHDAFMQNQLTLSALKLASEVLVRGGWFITKVFRSKDYLSLVWVFKKLFKRVHVTKPQASRNESAEIFVVCQGYLAPDVIDPKFLDPSSLFKEIEEKETKTNLDEMVKTRKKALGYDEDEKAFAKLKASEFIFSENHLQKLGKCQQIVFDDPDIRDHRLTTQEIIECCKDIKVLGKADLKSLLTWRKHLRETIKGLESEEKKKEPVEPTEEEEIDEAVKLAEEMELEKLQEAKKKKKKILKEKRKTHERLNLKMIIKDDEPIIEEDRELFRLSQIKNSKDLGKLEDNCDVDAIEMDDETPKEEDINVLASGFRSTYEKYNRERKDNLSLVPEKEPEEESLYSSDEEMREEIEFESDDDADETKEEEAETTEAILEGVKNPLVVDLVERPDRVNHTVKRWFDKEEFNTENIDETLELDLIAERYDKKSEQSIGKTKKEKPKKNKKLTEISEESDDAEEDGTQEEIDTLKPEKRKKRVRLDPEGMALGSMMVQSKKMKRDIVESAYNRYASNDENLPDWFEEDEKKHYRKELPVTAEMVREYRQRLKEINARPIKKVVEAKARKKRRVIRRLEKARKQAEKVTEHPDMTDTEKAEHLRGIYKKAVVKENKQVTYVVAKKGGGKKAVRPAGVKGRYKVVDKRMKKDNQKDKSEFHKTKFSKMRMQKNKRDARRNNKRRKRK